MTYQKSLAELKRQQPSASETRKRTFASEALFALRNFALRICHTFDPRRGHGSRLVAETGADGNLVTALGATAVENGGTGLGLHAGEEAVGLRAMAAVGLKGALRHGTNSCSGLRLVLILGLLGTSLGMVVLR